MIARNLFRILILYSSSLSRKFCSIFGHRCPKETTLVLISILRARESSSDSKLNTDSTCAGNKDSILRNITPPFVFK